MGVTKRENQTIITFGTGDIKVTSAMIDGDAVLGLREQTPKEIGSLQESNETVESISTSDVYIVFTSLKSLEVLILKLQQARSFVVNNAILDYTERIKNITDIYEPNSFLKG